MKVGVNQNLCNGAGICVQTVPDVFRFREGSGKARVIAEEVPPRLERRCREAARKCPVNAVLIFED